MSEFVLEKLDSLDKVGGDPSLAFIGGQIDLDFTTAATTRVVVLHVSVQLHEGVVVDACTGIKHKAVLGFDVLADTLEEPSMRVNLTIVPMLDSEAQMDTPSLEHVICETHIPSSHLEHVEDVLRDFLLGHVLVHDVLQVAELKVALGVLVHEAFLNEHALIEKALVSGKLLEAFSDLVVSITDHKDKEVILGEVVGVLLCPDAVVVVDEAPKGGLQLHFLFVVHGDTDSHGWGSLSDQTARAYLRQQGRLLDLPWLSISTEASTPNL